MLLPGLITHQMLVCRFTVQSEYLGYVKPSGRLYPFLVTEQAGLQVAATVTSQAFCWAQGATLTLE